MIFHNKHHIECWLNSVAWAPDNQTFLFGCRPNSHAGKPAVHQALTITEAFQSEAAQGRRDELDRSIAEHLAKTTDTKKRDALEKYRQALRQSTQTQLAPEAQTLSFADQAAVGLGGAGGGLISQKNRQAIAPGGALGDAVLKELPADVQEMAKTYQKTVEEEVRRLQSNYCVNQWKVRRVESPPKK